MQMKARIPASVRQELAGKGHEIGVRGDYAPQMGAGQAVMRNASNGVNYGASDPRKDGAAIAEPWLPAEMRDRRLPGDGRSGQRAAMRRDMSFLSKVLACSPRQPLQWAVVRTCA